MLACGDSSGVSSEGSVVFCGMEDLEQEQWVVDKLVSDTATRTACWALWDEGSIRLRTVIPGGSDSPDGECNLEAPTTAGPFTGTCHWWRGANQWLAQVIPEESSVSWTDALDLNLRVNTTQWNGNALVYGRGNIRMPAGSVEKEGPSPFSSVPKPPNCTWEHTCYQGEFILVEAVGPGECQEAVNAQAGTLHTVTIVSDHEVDLGRGLLRAAGDLNSCKLRYSLDGNAFNVYHHTFTQSEISIEQFVQFTTPAGSLIDCELRWVIETEACP